MLQGIDPNNRDMINSTLRLLQARLVGEAEVKKSMQDCASTAKLALVDLRLCLDYDPLHQDTRPLMQHMVSSHMRYVYSVPVHRNYVRTGYPSEPLLAEVCAIQRLRDSWLTLFLGSCMSSLLVSKSQQASNQSIPSHLARSNEPGPQHA